MVRVALAVVAAVRASVAAVEQVVAQVGLVSNPRQAREVEASEAVWETGRVEKLEVGSMVVASGWVVKGVAGMEGPQAVAAAAETPVVGKMVRESSQSQSQEAPSTILRCPSCSSLIGQSLR